MIEELKSVHSVELVWREFKIKRIHIWTEFLDTSDPNFWKKPCYYSPPGPHYKISPSENRFFQHGFPLPEKCGVIADQSELKRAKIFMDDVFLCPHCGSFYFLPEAEPKKFDWLLKANQETKVAAIEERWHKKEFEFRHCKNRQRCSEAFKNIVESIKREWKREEVEATYEKRTSLKPNVYLIGNMGHIKIGIAVHVRNRLLGLQTSSPFKLKLLKSWECVNAVKNEKKLHKKYAKFRANGEWFQLPDDIVQTLVAIDDLDLFLNRRKRKK